MPFGWGNSGPTPAQKQLGEVLFNDSLHVLSSFELNRVASLTYGDDVCEEIFEMLEQVQARPMDQSPLTVQKSLVITKHVLVYGSEKCVNSAMGLQRGVEALLEFNTVLWGQKLQGAAAVMYRLKGGGVDKGFQVREAAKEVWPLMTDVSKLRNVRNSSADPNSLVPVGNNKVAFLSDDVRHYLLKKRIQEQYACQTKSNLVKEAGGFGSGYTSTDGKAVVGAAHGLDEMIKQAERANNKFSDEGNMSKYEMPNLAELSAMSGTNGKAKANTPTGNDLLAARANLQQGTTAVADLLDFSVCNSQPQGASGFDTDLLGTGGIGASDLLGTSNMTATADLLGTSSSVPASESINIFLDAAASGIGGSVSDGKPPDSNELLHLELPSAPTPGHAPDAFGLSDQLSLLGVAGGEATNKLSSSSTLDPMQYIYNPTSVAQMDAAPMKNAMNSSTIMSGSVMGGSGLSPDEDPFASLEVPATKNSPSMLSAIEAENRLLSYTPSDVAGATSPTISLSMCSPVAATTSDYTRNDSHTIMTDPMIPSISTVPVADPGIQGVDMAAHTVDCAISSNGMSELKVAPAISSLNVSTTFGDANDDDTDVFVMGGNMGAGLEPTAAAPAAPPPPPPI